MPVHDWTRVPAGIFHDFHHEWISTIKHALNRRLAGTEYYALAEQVAGGWGPDVLTLERPSAPLKERGGATVQRPKPSDAATTGAVALAEAPPVGSTVTLAASPPRLRYRITDDKKWYAARKKAVTICHVSDHRVVAVLEILSPGNKASRGDLDDFVHKARDLLSAGVHFALVDLFPPTRRDPQGIHPLVWGEDADQQIPFDAAKPLTCASYRAAPVPEAFVEPLGIGDPLPELPVFLSYSEYVPVPLDSTYQAAADEVPSVWSDVLTRG